MTQSPGASDPSKPQQTSMPYQVSAAGQPAQNYVTRQPTPPRKKQSKAGWVVGIIVVLGIIGAVTGTKSGSGSSATPSSSQSVNAFAAAPISTTHTVKYEVTGSATSIDLTYNLDSDDASQENGRAVPWSKSFSADEGNFLYVSAQNGGESGNVTCTIYVDGVAAKTNTSTGGYTIATCSGRL